MEEFEDFLACLEGSIRDLDFSVIAAGGFTSKSGSWGSPVEDARGVLLADLIASINMTAGNKENSPTFVRGNSEMHQYKFCPNADYRQAIRLEGLGEVVT